MTWKGGSDESEAFHTRAGHPQASLGRGGVGQWAEDGSGLQDARDLRADLLLVAPGIRRSSCDPSQGAEGVGEGQRPVEEAGGRAGPG